MPSWKIKGGNYLNTDDVGLTQDLSSLLINGYIDDLDNTIKIPGKSLFAFITDNNNNPVQTSITGLFFWRYTNTLIITTGPFTSPKIYWIDMNNISYKGQCIGNATLSGLYPPTFTDGLWGSNPKIWIADGGRMINLIVVRDVNGNITSVTSSYVADLQAPFMVSHVGYIDGYVLANALGTSKIYSTVDPTNPDVWYSQTTPNYLIIDCNYRSGNIIAFTIFNREIVCFGSASIEIWYLNPNAVSTPFSRIESANYDIGIASSTGYCIIDNLLFWMDGQQQLRCFDGRTALIISTNIQKYLSDLKTQDVKLVLGLVEGRSCIFIILPSAGINNGIAYGVTLCYDIKKKDWALWGETTYNYNYPSNPLYGGTQNFNGFRMARDKINCSVQIFPLLNGDANENVKISSIFIDSIVSSGTVQRWSIYPTDTWDNVSLYFNNRIATEQGTFFCINNMVFRFGGHTHNQSTTVTEYTDLVSVYNPNGQSWNDNTYSKFWPMAYMSSVVHDKTLFFVGGRYKNLINVNPIIYAKSNVVGTITFDTIQQIYTPTYFSFPVYTHSGGLCYISNWHNYNIDVLIYIGVEGVFGAYLSDLNVWYNFNSPLPTLRYGFGCVALDNKIYCIGGATNMNDYVSFDATVPMNVCNTVEVLNIITGTWENIDSPNFQARSAFGCAVSAGLIYCIGGWDVTKNATTSVQIFNPVTKTWTQGTAMPTAIAGFAAGNLPENTLLSEFDTESLQSHGGLYVCGGAQKQVAPYDLQIPTMRYFS